MFVEAKSRRSLLQGGLLDEIFVCAHSTPKVTIKYLLNFLGKPKTQISLIFVLHAIFGDYLTQSKKAVLDFQTFINHCHFIKQGDSLKCHFKNKYRPINFIENLLTVLNVNYYSHRVWQVWSLWYLSRYHSQTTKSRT